MLVCGFVSQYAVCKDSFLFESDITDQYKNHSLVPSFYTIYYLSRSLLSSLWEAAVSFLSLYPQSLELITVQLWLAFI